MAVEITCIICVTVLIIFGMAFASASVSAKNSKDDNEKNK